jgi:membrane associated rhomboid family serine protease
MPPVTTALIVANVAVYLLQTAVPQIVVPFALWPLATSSMNVGASFAPWQLVTYAFLHGSVLHIAFNMFALYMFGSAIEQVFGPRRYLLF